MAIEPPRPKLHSLRQSWRELRAFVTGQLWDVDLTALPRMKKLAVSTARVAVLVARGMVRDQCTLHSSALSYITVASLVPVLALVFAVSKGIGVHDRVTGTLNQQIEALPEKSGEFLQAALDQVEAVNLGALTTVGLLLVFFSVVTLLSRIEKAFNAIWGVAELRPPFRRFTDYISVLFVVPVLILVTTSVNTALSSGWLAQQLEALELGPLYLLYRRLIGLGGVMVLLLAFAFLYLFMPNTKVKVVPALVGGVVAGIGWYLTQRLYIEMQIGVANVNKIYGTFAAIPFFLGWLYVSWVIILFGAELSFAVQHIGTFAVEGVSERSSQATREVVGLVVMHQVAAGFLEGREPWSVQDFGREYEIPSRLLLSVARQLTEAGILRPVDERHILFVPGRALSRITMADIRAAFHGEVEKYAVNLGRREAPRAHELLAREEEVFRGVLGNATLADLLAHSSAGTTAEPA